MSRSLVLNVRLTEAEKARFERAAGTKQLSSWAREAMEEKASGSGALAGSSRVAGPDPASDGRPEPSGNGGLPPLPDHAEGCGCRRCTARKARSR